MPQEEREGAQRGQKGSGNTDNPETPGFEGQAATGSNMAMGENVQRSKREGTGMEEYGTELGNTRPASDATVGLEGDRNEHADSKESAPSPRNELSTPSDQTSRESRADLNENRMQGAAGGMGLGSQTGDAHKHGSQQARFEPGTKGGSYDEHQGNRYDNGHDQQRPATDATHERHNDSSSASFGFGRQLDGSGHDADETGGPDGK